MPNQTVWLILAVVAVIVVLLLIVLVMRRRRGQPGFQIHPLPAEEMAGRESRIDEIERLFVSQPREAVAAARLLVDEMLTRMGYPVRLTASERARDLRHYNRAHSDRYRMAGELRDDANTEEMRRALKGYLDTARDILAEARGRAGGPRPAVEEPRAVSEERPALEERSAASERPTAPEGRPAGSEQAPPAAGERRTTPGAPGERSSTAGERPPPPPERPPGG